MVPPLEEPEAQEGRSGALSSVTYDSRNTVMSSARLAGVCIIGYGSHLATAGAFYLICAW